jgi:hypothetical protein
VLLNTMMIIKTVNTPILIKITSLNYCKGEISTYKMAISDCTASLFLYIFVSLMMTGGEMKHVAILQKQGYCFIIHILMLFYYHHITTRHHSVQF